jgi:PKD repeat protein
MTGCLLRARDGSYADAGSDFDLVEFNNSIPDYYDVYYNGWNRTNSNEDAESGVGIHHPAGDIKKISTYDFPLQSSNFWNGLPTHWQLFWAETVNGKSIMQGGSSGSPVFDSNGLIMGDLTGGYASNSCETPSPAYYGKFYYSWDQNGTTSSSQLKPWLDPDNTGIEKLPGVSWEIIPPEADYEANNTTITQGETVAFTDLSGPGILSWEWSFEGGEPSSSIEEDPFVVYPDTGYFSVSLTVVNADGTDTELKTDYIHVQQMQMPEAEFEANNTMVEPGAIVYFTDLSLNNPTEWEWILEGASPSNSSQQNPIVRYNDPGIFDVTLISSNLGGSDTLTKEDYIHVSVVGIEENNSEEIVVYPNPNNGNFYVDFKDQKEKLVNIEICNAKGHLVKEFSNVSTIHKFPINLNNISRGNYVIYITCDDTKITKQISVVD